MVWIWECACLGCSGYGHGVDMVMVWIWGCACLGYADHGCAQLHIEDVLICGQPPRGMRSKHCRFTGGWNCDLGTVVVESVKCSVSGVDVPASNFIEHGFESPPFPNVEIKI